MSFKSMTGSIVVVAYFYKSILAPESAISSVFLLGEFGWVLIQFINLILGLLISILLMIAPNFHLHPLLLLSIQFLYYASSLWPVLFTRQVLFQWVKFLPQLQQ